MKKCSRCGRDKCLSLFNKKVRGVGYTSHCSSCILLDKKYYQKNKADIYLKNQTRDILTGNKKEYYKNNKEHIINRVSDYRNKNRKRFNETTNLRERRLRRESPMYNLKQKLRSRVYVAFKRRSWQRDSSNVKLLGVDFETAKLHIERLFKKGMSWENMGEWEIDHVVPLASAKTPEELILLCHYTNLQPLWKEDNRQKFTSITEHQLKIAI